MRLRPGITSDTRFDNWCADALNENEETVEMMQARKRNVNIEEDDDDANDQTDEKIIQEYQYTIL